MTAVYLLLALCVAAIVAAGNNDFLCSSDQYEMVGLGKVAMQSPNSQGGVVYSLRMIASTDHVRQMEVVREVVETDSGDINVIIYTDYKTGTEYVAYPDSQTCKMFSHTDPMIRYCRENDKFMPVASLKLGKEMADVFEYTTSRAKYTTTLLRDDFIPVSLLTEGIFDGVLQMVALQTGNFTLGIQDESIFNVPSYCKAKGDVIGYMTPNS